MQFPVLIIHTRLCPCTASFESLLADAIFTLSWLRGTVVEHRSLASKLSLSCARPAAAG